MQAADRATHAAQNRACRQPRGEEERETHHPAAHNSGTPAPCKAPAERREISPLTGWAEKLLDAAGRPQTRSKTKARRREEKALEGDCTLMALHRTYTGVGDDTPSSLAEHAFFMDLDPCLNTYPVPALGPAAAASNAYSYPPGAATTTPRQSAADSKVVARTQVSPINVDAANFSWEMTLSW
eukprot:CAMPEP_0173387282 /NCGR_PEP_ID=MMETSP1356-20130122/9797_1 /TAXON_ID=77927 ORGANISM="Hemiselmis virescens, Strain PCC157" /NCGR_SAMPLE_ID=MMETSP1356 /ASSEMBLY_ACC=CAM_ASM_000847 /LENGTH=182 /DNA_ID=CAMNT_0014343825 /DNA_START=176 /DNA_END=724 /DNA_ORIENTATION=+